MIKQEKVSESGYILPFTLVALGVILFVVLFVVNSSQNYFQNTQYNYQAEQAMAIAEAGVDKALASLNATWGSYLGEQETFLGEGSYAVTVTNQGVTNKLITVTGFVPSKHSSKVKRKVSIQVRGLTNNHELIKGTYQIN